MKAEHEKRLEPGEFDDLLAWLDETVCVRDAMVCCMLHDSAMRIGDALHIQLDDLSPDKTLATIRDGKWRTEQDTPDLLPISRRTIERIELYLPERYPRQGGPLVLSGTGSAMYQQHFQRLLAREGPRAIGRHVHPHMLRHTAISEAALGTLTDPKKSMPLVQKFARHRNMETTMQYIHVDPSWAKDWFASG